MANFLRASLISSLASVLSLTFGFASTVIVARVLGVSGSGTVALALWIAMTLAIVADIGIPQTVLRYIGSAEADRGQGRVLARTLLGPFSLSVLLTLLVLAGYTLWVSRDGLTEQGFIWSATAILYLVYAFASFALATARGLDRFGESARDTLYGCLLQAPLVFIGAYFFGIAGAMLGHVARHLPQALGLRRYIGVSTPVEPQLWTPAMRRHGRNVWASGLIDVLTVTRIEFLFLGWYFSSMQIGYFAAGLTLAGLVEQLTLQISQPLLINLGRQHDRNNLAQLTQIYQRVFRWIAIFIFPICFGGAAIMPELLPTLFGEDFRPAIGMAIILMAFSCTTAFAVIPWALIGARSRSDFFLWYSPVTAVVTFMVLGVVVPLAGGEGAAWARGALHTASLGWLVWFAWRRLDVPLPLSSLVTAGLSAVICATAAHAVLGLVHGIPGMLLAIPIAAVTYAISLRVFRVVPVGDIALLQKALGGMLPARVGPWVVRGLALLTAEPAR